MKKVWPAVFVLSFAATGIALRLAGQQASTSEGPHFTKDGRLERPANYREWIWLSSGLGMAYGPAAQGNANADPPFDNVFVTPAAYRGFLGTGKWPYGTMFVLELRSSVSKGSINQRGHYQGGRRGMEVEVKDARFPGNWAFFDFGSQADSAEPFARSAACYSCHAQNGAVDNTFVQFYPTLLEVARQKGTFKLGAEGK